MTPTHSLTRFWIPTAIVLFWGGMMGSLLKDRILPERIRERQSLVDDEVLASKWNDITEWSWIYRQGRRCGASGLRIVQESHPDQKWDEQVGYRLDQATTLDVSALGQTQTVTMKIAVQLRRNFQVDCFRAQAVTALLALECEGFADGSRLYYRVRNTLPGMSPAQEAYEYGYLEVGRQALSMVDAVKPMMARHGNLTVGETYSIATFDPFGGMNAQKAVVRVADTEKIQIDQTTHECFRLETTVGDITRKSWVDEMGQTLRREILMGYIGETSSWSKVARVYPHLYEKIELPQLDRAEFKARAKAVSLQPAAPMASFLGLPMDLSGNRSAATPPATPEESAASRTTSSSRGEQP